MGENESVPTFDYFFDLARKEKKEDELQKLDENFYKITAEYTKGKKEGLDEKAFSEEVGQRKITQFHNVKELITKIYNLRQFKILRMATIKVEFSGEGMRPIIQDLSNMLPEEKVLYDWFVLILEERKDKVLKRIIKGEMPLWKNITETTKKEENESNKNG